MKRKKELQLHVKWSGFDDSENTWEPFANLMVTCPEVVVDFMQDNHLVLKGSNESGKLVPAAADPKPVSTTTTAIGKTASKPTIDSPMKTLSPKQQKLAAEMKH